MPVAFGRFLADHIEGASFVELPGGDLAVTAANQVIADEVAEFLTGERPVIEVNRVLTTVLVTDIVASTERVASLGDHRWRSLLDAHDRAVRDQLRLFSGREINTTGDGFIACFDGPARAIRCAQAIIEVAGKLGVDLRAGLHTGECEVRNDDLAGLAVHIAARIGAMAGSRQALVSATVKDLVVGSVIEFRDGGEHELKGVPGTWKLFAVAPGQPGRYVSGRSIPRDCRLAALGATYAAGMIGSDRSSAVSEATRRGRGRTVGHQCHEFGDVFEQVTV